MSDPKGTLKIGKDGAFIDDIPLFEKGYISAYDYRKKLREMHMNSLTSQQITLIKGFLNAHKDSLVAQAILRRNKRIPIKWDKYTFKGVISGLGTAAVSGTTQLSKVYALDKEWQAYIKALKLVEGR